MNDGIRRYDLINDNDIEITDFSPPKSYTDVKHVVGKCNGYSCPVPTVNIPDAKCDDSLFEFHRVEEKNWMDAVLQPELDKPKCWSSYHARQKRSQVPSPCNSAIFPLLKDVVHTMDMQPHLISLAIDYTEHLNPQQVTAVDCSDQPIYALSKINQWLFPKFAFPRYLPLFGALHIEKALLIANGNLTSGTGLNKLLGDQAIETIGLETASMSITSIKPDILFSCL